MSAFRYQVIDPPEEGLGIIGPPPGAIAFNKSGSIVIPASGSGDAAIFSFRVPFGYDSMILGQYHGATFSFPQGAGLLIWRLSADARYLRDCGNFLVSIGTNRTMSPIIGGLQLRSGNLCTYWCNNSSGGTLPANGIIFAGVHGYHWPRQ